LRRDLVIFVPGLPSGLPAAVLPRSYPFRIKKGIVLIFFSPSELGCYLREEEGGKIIILVILFPSELGCQKSKAGGGRAGSSV
jgi:hypothetical protein